MNYAVIGAGVSGLAVARMLLAKGHDVRVFERNCRPGGLIQCSREHGHLYHRVGGHVFNSRRTDVLAWFWQQFDCERDFIPARRHAVIALPGDGVVDYPIENHLRQLPTEWRAAIVRELLNLYAASGNAAEPRNLAQFFQSRFGATLNRLYFTPYNNKIWQQDIRQIALDWLAGKLPMPTVAEILLNNINAVQESDMVHSSFFYPKQGGSQFLANELAQGLDIVYGADIAALQQQSTQWCIQGTCFDRVIFTGNVRRLGALAPMLPVPTEQLSALKSHGTTSVLCQIDATPYSWVYLPDSTYLPHRIICTGNFAPSNNAGDAITATVEFSTRLTQPEIEAQLALLPFHPHYITHHWQEYTYPVQDEQSRTLVQQIKAMTEPHGLYLLGRFAEWEYYNMDAAMGAALDLVARLHPDF